MMEISLTILQIKKMKLRLLKKHFLTFQKVRYFMEFAITTKKRTKKDLCSNSNLKNEINVTLYNKLVENKEYFWIKRFRYLTDNCSEKCRKIQQFYNCLC